VDRVTPLPESVSFEQGCQLFVSLLTALKLVELLNIKPGEWLLQTAANSSMGQLCIQWARIFGYKTINVVRQQMHVAALQKLGAEAFIVLSDGSSSFKAQLRQLIKNERIRHAVDCVGGSLLQDTIESLADGGQVIVYGALSGSTSCNVLTSYLLKQSAIVRGWHQTRWWRNLATEEEKRHLVNRGIEVLSSGKIHFEVETFDLSSQWRAAFESSSTQSTPSRKKAILVG